MTKQAKPEHVTATHQLCDLFDSGGIDALSLNFAQALAEAEALNRT